MYVSYVHFEGSPELGYLSHGQLEEHIQPLFEVDERRAGLIADKVFRQLHHLRALKGQGLRHSELGELIMTPDTDTSYLDWEVGWNGGWDEMGVIPPEGKHALVNLDYLVSEIGSDVRELKKHYTPQVAKALGSFITERRAFMLGSTTEVEPAIIR